MAHIDCDAFYAAVEKRDNPAIADAPVIIGGGRRGVVSTACYVARTFGVRSAMPTFKALELCPTAIIISPNIQKYACVSRQIKNLMLETTPLVESLSLDEAFLDLTGTERLHRASPCQTLAKLSQRIEKEVGVTVSIGLSFNKFLAKIASDLDKPRGFRAIGRQEALNFLVDKPVTLLPGVGKAFAKSLSREGIFSIGHIRQKSAKEMTSKFGASGLYIWRLSHAEDSRTVEGNSSSKGISAETTFDRDSADIDELARILWLLCEKVSARAKAAALGGRTVQLKLKSTSFQITTRRKTLERPTQLARRIYETAHALLTHEASNTRYRLIGVGISDLVGADLCDESDLIDGAGQKKDAAERAMDKVRAKFGAAAIKKGRSLT